MFHCILFEKSDDKFEQEYDDDKWYPSYRTLVFLVLANIIVAIGVGLGIYYTVKWRNDLEAELKASSAAAAAATIPPTNNIFNRTAVMARSSTGFLNLDDR